MLTSRGRIFAILTPAAFLILIGSPPAYAWSSSLHQSVARFSQLGRLDIKVRGKQSAIIDGADAPDRKKPFKPADHYTHARFRAVRAFNGAVRLHREAQALETAGNQEEADKKYNESAFAIGNAFHYISDLAASEKVVDDPGFLPMIGPKGHKEQVRKLAEDMIARLVRDRAALGTFRKSVDKCKETTFRKYDDLLPMLAYIQEQLTSYGGKARNAFAAAGKNKEAQQQSNAALNEAVRLNLVLTVACLDRTIELYNEQVNGYYAMIEVTFPLPKDEIRPKRRDGESQEEWTARRRAFYERLTLNDVAFKPMPLQTSSLVFRITGEGLRAYPRERFTKQVEWALPFSTSSKNKDGTVTPINGTLLLTIKGLYDTRDDLLQAHAFLKDKKDFKPLVFDSKEGTIKGVNKNNPYAAGPLSEGWTSADRQRAFEFAKAIGQLYDCFVAHAVYGDPSAPAIGVFRDFRDRILSRTAAGRRLIGAYYERGPWLALHLQHDARALAEVRRTLDALALILAHVNMDSPRVRGAFDPLVRWVDKAVAAEPAGGNLLDLIARSQVEMLE